VIVVFHFESERAGQWIVICIRYVFFFCLFRTFTPVLLLLGLFKVPLDKSYCAGWGDGVAFVQVSIRPGT